MVSSDKNEYSEEGVYLYSLKTKTACWEKVDYTGQIPSSKFIFKI
jgi:hypothetical protein